MTCLQGVIWTTSFEYCCVFTYKPWPCIKSEMFERVVLYNPFLLAQLNWKVHVLPICRSQAQL